MKKLACLLVLLFVQPVYAYDEEISSNSFCMSGNRQSPINITQVISKELPQITLDYLPVEMYVYNTDINVFLKPNAEISFEYEGGRFRLIEVHMHQPGEHTIDGKTFPMEIHYVHQAPNNQFMVIAQLVNIGPKSKPFEKLLVQMSLAKGQIGRTQVEFGYNPADMIAKNHDYYTYEGSLTTEPCAQNVKWMVLKDVIQVSQGQVDVLKDLIGYNSRSLQPRNNRTIYSSIP